MSAMSQGWISKGTQDPALEEAVFALEAAWWVIKKMDVLFKAVAVWGITGGGKQISSGVSTFDVLAGVWQAVVSRNSACRESSQSPLCKYTHMTTMAHENPSKIISLQVAWKCQNVGCRYTLWKINMA